MSSSLLHQFLPMCENKCLICLLRFRLDTINELSKNNLYTNDLAFLKMYRCCVTNRFATTCGQRYPKTFVPLFQVCENGLNTLLLILPQTNTSGRIYRRFDNMRRALRYR